MTDHDVKLVPVPIVRDPNIILYDDAEIICYDIFVNGAWIGSRRTFRQAVEAQSRHKQLLAD